MHVRSDIEVHKPFSIELGWKVLVKVRHVTHGVATMGIYLRTHHWVMRSHHHKFLGIKIPSLMKISYDLILHGCILLSCSFFVNFQERIKKEKSSSISKSKSLYPLIVSVGCRESSDLKATLKKIHAFGKHALMVASIDENRPKSGYSCNFIQEEQIHLAMICLKIVSVVSVEN